MKRVPPWKVVQVIIPQTLGEGSLWFDRNHIQSSNNSKLNEGVLSHVCDLLQKKG